MLEDLKQKVYEANIKLTEYGLITFTWGNVSGIDRVTNLMVIKPSGVEYDNLKASDMVVVDASGKVVEGRLNPSTDAPTHRYLYDTYPDLAGICHTHSVYATSWCQAGLDLPVQGTTHADNFYGPVPITKPLDAESIKTSYEHTTGELIVESFKKNKLDWKEMPACLVNGHGPFTFGTSPKQAVDTAKVLETVAQITLNSYLLNKNNNLTQDLLDKHYFRKHGKNAYYGQKK